MNRRRNEGTEFHDDIFNRDVSTRKSCIRFFIATMDRARLDLAGHDRKFDDSRRFDGRRDAVGSSPRQADRMESSRVDRSIRRRSDRGIGIASNRPVGALDRLLILRVNLNAQSGRSLRYR